MHCPNCGSRKLRVGVVFAGEVTCHFHTDDAIEMLETAALDSMWDSNADCSCLSCSWSGTVSQAGPPEDALRQPVALTDQELQTIMRELQTGDCPAELAREVRKLVDTVRTLRVQLEIARRANRHIREEANDSDDTNVF